MKKRSIVLAGVLFCLVFFLHQVIAEETILTWQDCVKQTLNNQPDLISAKEKIKQSEADKTIIKSNVLPQITSSAGTRKSKSSGAKQSEAYSYSVTGQQLLFDGFKTSANIAAAIRTISAQQYDYEVISSNVRLNLRAAFVNLLRGQELISLTEGIVDRRKQNLKLVNLRYNAGREHRGSLMTAEANLAQAEFEATQAERNLSLSQRRLSIEMGFGTLLPATVKGTFDIIETNRQKSDLEYLADTTPFLKELTARKEAARFNYNSAKADFFPKVYLNSSIGKSDSDWPPKEHEWSAGLSLSFPLFEGGSQIAKLSKTKSQLLQAQVDEYSGRNSVILTLETTWKAFQDAIDTVSVKKIFFDAAQERSKIAGAQYSTGLIGFDDWIIIEDNLVSAEKSFLDARANLLLREAEWIQAKGGILEYEEY
ncbi:MAG: TolC family protein [Candidatus Omnitrophota bacterium]